MYISRQCLFCGRKILGPILFSMFSLFMESWWSNDAKIGLMDMGLKWEKIIVYMYI